jgi:cytochrome c-type biogenesis protein CcmH/NrfG
METVFWVIVAIVVLAVVYTCVLPFMKRNEALRRTLTAPDKNEHGVDLQARRKTFDDLT